MRNSCKPNSFSFKAFFLAPHAENQVLMHEAIIHILNEWISWRKETFKEDGLILPDKEINHSEFKKKKKIIQFYN